MALIKWSGLVSEVKGKLNGTVFSNPTYGAQMRNRKANKGRGSSGWSLQKTRIGLVSSSWKDLTLIQQLSFSIQAPNYLFTDRFGNTYEPSPYALFCQLNLNLKTIDSGPLNTAMAPNTEVDFTPVVLQVGATGTLEFTYTNPADASVYAVYYISPPQSKGVYYTPNKMKFVDINQGNQASPFDIDSKVESLYGPVTNGQKYFWRMEVVDSSTGQRYGNYSGSLVVSGHT